MTEKTWKYSVPVMRIQDTLTNLSYNETFTALLRWILETIEEERDNWGIKGVGYGISYQLEKRWYPVFHFDNAWLADAFIQYLDRDHAASPYKDQYTVIGFHKISGRCFTRHVEALDVDDAQDKVRENKSLSVVGVVKGSHSVLQPYQIKKG